MVSIQILGLVECSIMYNINSCQSITYIIHERIFLMNFITSFIEGDVANNIELTLTLHHIVVEHIE